MAVPPADDIVPKGKPKRLSYTREKTGWGKAAFKLRFIPFLGGPKERDEDIFDELDGGSDANGVGSAIPALQPTSSVKSDLGIVPKVKGKRFAGVEGGGTTWVVAISEGVPENIVERAEFPTTDDPMVTLGGVRAWLDARAAEGRFDAIGIATFGPVDLDKNSPTYGYITHSPKPGWADVDVLGILADGFDCPAGFDTDVNAPALSELSAMRREMAIDAGAGDGGAEGAEGAEDSIQNLCYVTVGTGVGVGVVCGGEPVHGLSHPEAGHIRVARLPRDGMPGEPGAFEGGCPYHSDCVEGMANASAIARRCGCRVGELSEVPDDHDAWDAAAHYLAGLCSVLVMTASPQRIVLGGGVLQRKTLVTKVRAQLKRQLGGYVAHDLVSSKRGLVEFIVSSKLGNDAGIVGALAVAEKAKADWERERNGGGAPGGKRRYGWREHLLHFGIGVFSSLVTLKVVDGKITVGKFVF